MNGEAWVLLVIGLTAGGVFACVVISLHKSDIAYRQNLSRHATEWRAEQDAKKRPSRPCRATDGRRWTVTDAGVTPPEVVSRNPAFVKPHRAVAS
jgi:hypothetical protein